MLNQRKAIGEQPNEIELFYITHYNAKNDWSSEKAQVVYVSIVDYFHRLINIIVMLYFLLICLISCVHGQKFKKLYYIY